MRLQCRLEEEIGDWGLKFEVLGQNFRDLKVWQLGMQLAEEVYRLSQEFPKHEVYGLCSQIQRAGVSIVANIAEGRVRLRSTKDCLILAIELKGRKPNLKLI